MWRNAVPTTWPQRVAQHIVKREQFKNNMVQLEIEAAEQSLAKLQLAAAGLHESDDEVSECSSPDVSASVEDGCGSSVSFSTGYHPESTYRNLIRPGTPVVLPATPVSDITDDEDDGSFSDDSLLHPTPPPPTPEPHQSPVYLFRALNASEFWDEEAPVEPILYAPVPLRPLINPEQLLVGYYEEPEESSPEEIMDRRRKMISGFLSDIDKIQEERESMLRHR